MILGTTSFLAPHADFPCRVVVEHTSAQDILDLDRWLLDEVGFGGSAQTVLEKHRTLNNCLWVSVGGGLTPQRLYRYWFKSEDAALRFILRCG